MDVDWNFNSLSSESRYISPSEQSHIFTLKGHCLTVKTW